MTTCPHPVSSFTPIIDHDNPTLSWVGYDRGVNDIFAVHYVDKNRTLQCLDIVDVKQTPLVHTNLLRKTVRKPDHILKRRRKNKAARKARKKT